MRVGVTGGQGVLGSRICAVLRKKGHSVSSFRGDVRDPAAVNDWIEAIDCVIHCAAIVPVGQVVEHLGAAVATNVGGTANLASAATRSGAKLVYISTSHVYQPRHERLREDDPVSPISLYGLTKHQGEQWVDRLDPSALIVRLFSYFDVYQESSFLVPSLCARIAEAKQGAMLDLFGGNNRRDITTAAWLAEACCALIACDAKGVVNCAAGNDMTVLCIAQRLAGAMGREDVIWNVVQDRPVDTLISDNSRLHSLAPTLPPFDIDKALAGYVEQAAPRDGKRARRWLER